MSVESTKPLPAEGRVAGVKRYLPLGLALFYFGFVASMPTITTRWLDFPVYWEAGKKAALGLTVYDVGGHFQYKYSPLIALLFGKVLGGMPFETASFVFQKTMLALWAALFFRFARRDYRVAFVAILFLGNALRLDLELGQVNAIVLCVLALLFTALERPRSWREDIPFATVFSLAVQLKLFSLVVIPLLVLRREWRKLALGLAFLPILSVGGVAIEHGWAFAVAENRAWIGSLMESTDALLLSEQNVGALGSFGKAFGLGAGKLLWLALGAGFAAYLWRNRSRPVAWFRDWLLYAIAVFNPLVWSYWVLYALPLLSSRLPDFEGAFRRRSFAWRAFGAVSAIFTFAAWNGQHARWAWQGGIFVALLLLGVASSRVRAAPRAEGPSTTHGSQDVFKRSPWSFPSRSK